MELRSLNPGLVIGAEKFDDWQYPELTARRTDAQEPMLFWRGRGLGGSSTINGIIAIRALPDDHDRWGPGWTYLELLPYLCRLEDDVDFGAAPYHGSGGPVPVWRMPQEAWGPIDVALRDAALAAGHPWCPDHNAPTGTGVSPYAINARSGARVSTNDAYLEPARHRPNLRIVGDALVDRVRFGGGRAVGVRARVDGRWTDVGGGEVLLCAGAVGSPAILQRSGIGPAAVLRAASIDQRVELPVGEHLQDHPIAYRFVQVHPERRPAVTDRHTNCCVRYSSGLAGTGENDMMLVAMNHTTRHPGVGLLAAWVNQCFSEGRLWVTSAAPEVLPSIDERMLSDERDLVRLRDGMRRVDALVAHDAFAAIGEPLPLNDGDGGLGDDDGELDRWLVRHSSDAQHVCATARMGDVVDADCRVLGTDALRVVDASVFPAVPRANTHLTVLAVAECMGDRLRH
jgi:choline dehydrogenase-like flavoprotein